MSGKFKHSQVLFLGGESSGKSTITIEAAKATDSLYAHEFGRQFYEERPNKNTSLTTSRLLLRHKTKSRLRSFSDRTLMRIDILSTTRAC